VASLAIRRRPGTEQLRLHRQAGWITDTLKGTDLTDLFSGLSPLRTSVFQSTGGENRISGMEESDSFFPPILFFPVHNLRQFTIPNSQLARPPTLPQALNRYAYVYNSPVNYDSYPMCNTFWCLRSK
jgi:hypothetical protein